VFDTEKSQTDLCHDGGALPFKAAIGRAIEREATDRNDSTLAKF